MALFQKLHVQDAPVDANVLREPERPRFRVRPAVVIRLGIAASFLAAAIYFSQEQLFSTVSIDGVVTAPMISLRAPIEGQVTQMYAKPGVEITANDPLFVIENSATSAKKATTELLARAQLLRTQLDQNIQMQNSVAAVKDELQQRRVAYTKATADRLTHMLEETHAQFKAAAATAERARRETSRATALNSKGAASQARLEDAVLAEKNANAEMERQYSLTRRIEVELTSARRGIMIGEGYGDVPYSQQRIDELTIKLITLRAERAQIEASLAETKSQLEAERRQNTAETRREIHAPVNALVRATHVAKGTSISKNAPLADLIDCDSAFLEATVSERTYDSLRIGDAVQVRLYGNPTLFDGIVRSVRGSGVRSGASDGAAQIANTAEAMTVAIDIPPEAIKRATAGTCQVGRIAKVMFDKRPAWPDRVKSIAAGFLP